MHALPEPAAPLLLRRGEEVLFRRPGLTVSADAFLAAATRLAASLPAAPSMVNLCRDRLHVALGFAAALLRGQVSILAGVPTASELAQFPARFPGAYALVEPDGLAAHTLAAHTLAGGALPLHRLAPPDWSHPLPGTAPGAAMPMIPSSRRAAIVLTSGTTGDPVAHEKSWGGLLARSLTSARRFGLAAEPAASVVGTVPSQHMYGFESTLLIAFHAPVASFCGEPFYPADIAAALAAVPAPRWLVTTPLHLRALLAARPGLPPLAGIISATAPLEAAAAQAAERAFAAPVFEIFGATEIGAIATRRAGADAPWEVYDNLRLEPRAGGVAVHAPGAAPGVIADLVELVDPTHFRLLGRREDVVKRAGKRVSLAALNQALTGIEGVIDGVFVAPEDLESRPQARLSAFVVAPERSAAEIRAALRLRIDPTFMPRRIVKVDRLPRNAVGKLPRAALAGLALAEPGLAEPGLTQPRLAESAGRG